ncbi:hypothetical protein OK074_4757 [Actinobacteria bacterium OK074]|nr:hypothetical protein OK074_4757 [Actinobacteria bacterium OK074]
MVARQPPTAGAVGYAAVDSPMDRRKHAGFEATGEIRRSDFGLDFGTGLLDDVVKLHLDMHFVGPQAQDG